MKRSYLDLLPYVIVITFIIGIVLSNQAAQAQSEGGYRFVTQWGSDPFRHGQLRMPHGVAVDALGNVYVADWENHCIQKFSSSGVFITKWGSEGSGDGQFKYLGLGDVAVDTS